MEENTSLPNSPPGRTDGRIEWDDAYKELDNYEMAATEGDHPFIDTQGCWAHLSKFRNHPLSYGSRQNDKLGWTNNKNNSGYGRKARDMFT